MKRLFWLTFSYASFPVLANPHSSKVADGMANLIVTLRAWLAMFWNLRIVLGLFVVFYGAWSWHRTSKMEEETSVMWIVAYSIGGALLTLHGAFDLFGGIFGFSDTVDPLVLDATGRANLSENTTYEFTQGESTTSK